VKFRSMDDAIVAGCALIVASGLLLMAAMFWIPLVMYVVDYWTGK
jgi:uncharacterized membrane protein